MKYGKLVMLFGIALILMAIVFAILMLLPYFSGSHTAATAEETMMYYRLTLSFAIIGIVVVAAGFVTGIVENKKNSKKE